MLCNFLPGFAHLTFADDTSLEHPGKNHTGLIRAYGLLAPALKEKYRLVLGGSDWNGAEEIHRAAAASPDAARIRQFEAICDQITAAHYQTIWYRGVDLGKTETGENVASHLHMQYWNDEITLDELVETLSSKMRLYLDE